MPAGDPQRLGSYRITSLLGSGGMGNVYRAYDETLRRDVAIKVLRATGADGEAARIRLLREARAAAALNHPNICTIHEVGEHEGQAYLAMELVDGQPLNELIPPATGLPVDRLLEYGVQVSDALAHAHERGVLHRDLKAQNIVITRTGRAKVLDFGLAKVVHTEAQADTISEVTAAGVVAGTPAYLSPEQLRGLPASTLSDVWALGVVLYEMAAGTRPFTGQTPYELCSAILSVPARPLPSGIPPDLQSVIARCLAKDPAARYESAEELRAALAAVSPTADPKLPAHTAPQRLALIGRREATVALAALATTTVLAFGWLNRGGIRDRLWNAAPLFDSIAVMPLENQAAGDEGHAYLTTGIQQELITELSQLPGFTKVISAGSARRLAESGARPVEIARTLGVRGLVTGSVSRLGERIQVAAQLIDGSDERQVWGGTFEGTTRDYVAIQREAAAAIAQAIQLRLRPEDRQRLAERTVIDPATYELYLRGMHAMRRVDDGGDREEGLKYLQQAIDRDPGNPHAYAALAKGWVAVGHSPAAPDDAWRRGRAAAERALTLAPDLADAHAVMADVKMYYEWDWDGAERSFRRANELNPNLAQNHYHYSWYLYLRDRMDEAIAEHERARELDPLTTANTAQLSVVYAAAHRYDDAIATAKAALEMDPESGVAWQALGFAYSFTGRHDQAIAAMQRAVEYAPPWTFALGAAYAQAGRLDDARDVLQQMLKRPPTAYGMWARAMLYIYLGDADGFFNAIAYTPHHAFAPWVRVEPPITRFRNDPRYAALFARFKLPPPK